MIRLYGALELIGRSALQLGNKTWRGRFQIVYRDTVTWFWRLLDFSAVAGRLGPPRLSCHSYILTYCTLGVIHS